MWHKRNDKIRRIINEWLIKIINKENRKYAYVSFDVTFRKVIIYTQYPGILIGCYGKNVNELKNMLKENGIKKDIRFIELAYKPYQAKKIIR